MPSILASFRTPLVVAFSVVLVTASCRSPDNPAEPQSQLAAGVAAPAELDVTITDLGSLGGNFSQAFSINAPGQVVGISRTADGLRHAFFWDGSTVTELGTLGGPGSAARAINQRGEIVGCSDAAARGHAFFWDGATMRDLGAPGGDDWGYDPSRLSSCAIAINSRGDVLGTTSGDLPVQHAAWVWDGTTVHLLGTLGG